MIDMVNSIYDEFDSLLMASNPGGVFPEDTARLRGLTKSYEFFFITRAYIANSSLPALIKKILLAVSFTAEPILFAYNLLLFCRYLKSLKPSVVLCCNGGYPAAKGVLAMTVAAKIQKVPVVLSIVSMPMARRKILSFYERFIDRFVWESADVIIVNASSIANSLHHLRDMPSEKAHVLYNGLEDRPYEGTKDRSSEDFVIGCVARMDRAKGVLYLFEAFKNLASRYPALRLVLAGKGDVTGELEKLAEDCGLKNRIDLLGYYDGDINDLLAGFDLYVFPSLHEGFPYSILEAMRAGCPIVSTDVGGIPEAIRDMVEGVLVKPESAVEIQNAVERLISDDTTRRRLGENARARFIKEFSLIAMRSGLKEIFSRSGLFTA